MSPGPRSSTPATGQANVPLLDPRVIRVPNERRVLVTGILLTAIIAVCILILFTVLALKLAMPAGWVPLLLVIGWISAPFLWLIQRAHRESIRLESLIAQSLSFPPDRTLPQEFMHEADRDH